MDEDATLLNKRGVNLYTPVWLGCPNFPPGRAPCRQTGKARRANQQRTYPILVRARSLTLRSKLARSFFCYVVARRLPCRRYVENSLFVSPTNSGDSRVNPNPTSELKARLSRDGCPVARKPTATLLTVLTTQRQRGLMTSVARHLHPRVVALHPLRATHQLPC